MQESSAVKTRIDGSPTRTRKGLIGAGIGNALEWFDWLIYAQFSLILATQFFPSGNPAAALLSTLAVFGAGFLFRPLGGYLLSTVTDRKGRRAGMVATITLMAGGTLLIGIAPTYTRVGLVAPVLLIVARMCQGMSAGGEFATVSSYLAEVAPAGKRGLYSSVLYISSTVGSLAATGLALLLHALLDDGQMHSWGWRIPFLLGALVGLVAMFLRRNMDETEAFVVSSESKPKRENGLVILLRHHRADFVRLLLISGLSGLWYYVFASYLPVYMIGQGLDSNDALLASVISLVGFILVLPAVAVFSDRYGRRLLIIAFTGLAAATVIPIFLLLDATFARQVTLQLGALLIFALFAAVGPIAMAEQFPTEIRAVGLGVPYSIGVAIFGGTAPFLIEWLSSLDRMWIFPLYVATLSVCTLVATLSMRDRRTADISEI